MIYTVTISDCDSQNIAQNGCNGEVRSFKTTWRGNMVRLGDPQTISLPIRKIMCEFERGGANQKEPPW